MAEQSSTGIQEAKTSVPKSGSTTEAHEGKGPDASSGDKVVEAIKGLLTQPVKQHLEKIDSSSKSTRYLERDGSWRNGIQVSLSHQDAAETSQAVIENYAIERDKQGRIISRDSLIVNTDGSVSVRHARSNKRRWQSKVDSASPEEITEALTAMQSLYEESSASKVENNGHDQESGYVPAQNVSGTEAKALPKRHTLTNLSAAALAVGALASPVSAAAATSPFQ
jgi:hypothetical protein